MTDAGDIRAEAIERIAHVDYERERAANHVHGDIPWPMLPEPRRDEWRRDAAVLVDALGDLLPTRIETHYLEDGWAGQNVDIHGHVTAVGKPCTRQHRYVSAWRTTDPTPATENESP